MDEIEFSKMDMLANISALAFLFSGSKYSGLNHSKLREIYKFQQDMLQLPKLAEKQKKSDVRSETLRTSGNQAFKREDYLEARSIYTKAMCCAEPAGKPIAMAYANRSAANFELHAYSEAINDINLALADGKYPSHLMHKLFERRGRCYLALSQYWNALEDVKKSISLLVNSKLDLRKIDHLKSLSDFLVQHLGKKNVPHPSSIEPPKLSHEPSTEIPCASHAVDVKRSDKFGRHVVATQYISPGDILAVEKPIISVLRTAMYEQLTYCEYCMIRCNSSIPCDSCNNVVFCSQQCRKKCWMSYHSIECDILPTIIHYGCPPRLLMAIRLLLKATKRGQDLQELVGEYLARSKDQLDEGNAPVTAAFMKNVKFSDEYISVHELITHEEDRSNKELLDRAIVTTFLIHIVKNSTKFFERSDQFVTCNGIFNPNSNLQVNHMVAAELIYRYLMVIDVNAYGFSETQLEKYENSSKMEDKIIGAGLYGFHSLLNHSCDPDVAHYSYSGDTHVLFAIKPIEKGQQIFICYGSDYAQHDLHARQTKLNRYLFTCECRACVNNWPLLGDVPSGLPTLLSRSKKVFKAVKGTHAELSESLKAAETHECSEEQFQALVRSLTIFHKHVKLPWLLYNLTQAALADYLIVKGNLFIQSKPGAHK